MQCYTAAISGVEQNLRTIMQLVHELTAGHLSLVVLPDYWSVWLGGQHAQAQGQMYVDAATVTDDVNTAIKTVAAETGSAYVDLRAASRARTTATTRPTTWPATATTPTPPATSRSPWRSSA